MKQYFALAVKNGLGIPIPTPITILLAIVLMIVGGSSWYIVGQQENAVVTRFGKYVSTESQGFHMKAPWPIEAVDLVPVTKVHQMEFGYRTISTEAQQYDEVPDEREMLTADTNIVELDWALQYMTPDAKAWLFNVKDPEFVLRLFGRASMRGAVSAREFDNVIASGRVEVQTSTKDVLLNTLTEIPMGVQVSTVQLQDVEAPKAVLPAFKDVNTAQEDKNRMIQQAAAHKAKVVPEARGKAEKMVQEALGYKSEVTERASGHADRFLAIQKEYHVAPELTKDRLRFDLIGDQFAGKSQIWDFSQGNSNLLKLLTLNRGADSAITGEKK